MGGYPCRKVFSTAVSSQITVVVFLYKDVEYTDTQMGSKTISIKDSTYDRLKARKSADESFSDAIDRLVNARDERHPLFDLVGLLDEEELENVREHSSTFRSDIDDRMHG